MAPAATCSTLGGDWLDDALADGRGATNDDLLGDGLALADDALGGYDGRGALYSEHGTSDNGDSLSGRFLNGRLNERWVGGCGGGVVRYLGHLGTTNERANAIYGVGVRGLVVGCAVVSSDITAWGLACLYGDTLAIKCSTTAYFVGTHDDADHSVVVVKY